MVGSIRRPPCLLTFVFSFVAALAMALVIQNARADDAQAALQKANLYIETIKSTERAVDSWERYGSWVNMERGPTGKERYISYGMYDLSDMSGLLKEARAASAIDPKVPKLDAAVVRYIAAYEALEPVMNTASAYYDRAGYKLDNAAEGQALHKQMLPLAKAFLAERDALTSDLRVFVRETEAQELSAIEARHGRSPVWHVGQAMHAANRVVDLFPRQRPQQMSSDAMDEMMNNLGPDTPGATFDQIISGVVPPTPTAIDVKRFGDALDSYAEATAALGKVTENKPDGFDEFAASSRQMLEILRAFREPLTKSQGHEFEGGGQMMGQIVETYFAMMNASSSIGASQLRYLP